MKGSCDILMTNNTLFAKDLRNYGGQGNMKQILIIWGLREMEATTGGHIADK